MTVESERGASELSLDAKSRTGRPLLTKRIREIRAGILERLSSLAADIGSLEAMTDPDRRDCMHRVAGEMSGCLRPHLEWEESTVHPIADKYACEGPAVFSASMRYEHGIIYRWLGELRDLADGEATAFRRRADNLLGVVLAHFELEENVLFPVLERSLPPGTLRALDLPQAR